MTLASVERWLEGALRNTPLATFVRPSRAVRFAEYVAVGATGALLDISITAALVGSTHYLVANAIGFLVANSWNFGLNYRFTFGSPEGSIARQYPAYLVWHAATFVFRAAVIIGLVEVVGEHVLIASVVGIAAASIANFAGSERIFGTTTASPAALRAGVGEWLNRIVHGLYTDRVRYWVNRMGLYAPLYGVYQRVLGHVYPNDILNIRQGDATATVHMENDAEVLSVLHTLRKESDMLEDFASSVQPDDIVWDVGANLGVFALLAADRAGSGRVVAFEPFTPTARRLEENVELSDPPAAVDIDEVALWNETGETTLGIDREELGTQTPTLDPRSGQKEVTATQVVGDDLVDSGEYPAPDVLKVDVEGAELPVLEGLKQSLPNCRLVYVEDHSDLWGGDGAGHELPHRLDSLGFDVEVVHQGGQAYFRGEQ